MSLFRFTLASLALYLILQHRLIPSLRSRWNERNSLSKIGKTGVLAALSSLRDLSFIASATYLLLLIGILAVGTPFGSTASDFASVLERLSGIRSTLTTLSEAWGLALFTVVLIGLLYLIYRNHKKALDERVKESLQREGARVRTEMEQGVAADLPPTEEMSSVLSLLHGAAGIEEEILRQGLSEEARRESMARLEAYRNALRQRIQMLDFERRVHVSLPVDLAPDRSPGLRARLRRILFSRGLFADLTSMTRRTAHVLNVLLFLCLVGFDSGAAARQAGNRILRIQDLQVNATREELGSRIARLDEAQKSDGPREPLDPGEEAAAAEVAGHFERAVAHSRIWMLPENGDAARRLRTDLVRRRVLEATSRDARWADAFKHDSTLADAAAGTAEQRELLHAFEKASTPEGPSTRLGRHYLEQIRSRLSHLPREARQSFLAKVKSYREPLRVMEVQRWLVGESIGMLYEGAVDLPAGDLARKAAGLGRTFSKSAAQEAVDLLETQFDLDLFGGHSLEEALKGVRESGSRYRVVNDIQSGAIRELVELAPRSESLTEAIVERPPALIRKAEVSADALKEVRELHAGGRSAERLAVDAVATYEDWVPGRMFENLDTPRGGLLNELRPEEYAPPHGFGGGGGGGGFGGWGGGGPRGPTPATRFQLPKPVMTRFQSQFRMARSFSRLRGFARVGGVLIGHEATGDLEPAGISDLTWTEHPSSTLTLTLTRDDGSTFSLPPQPRSMISQALAYAADGRPLAVTMTEAAPLLELKIHLHPALVDTPLGCRIISLDRYVDQFTSGDPSRITESGRITAQAALHKLAWYQRQRSLLERLSASVRTPEVSTVIASVRRRMEDPALRAAAATALRHRSPSGDAALPLLTAKIVYFDGKLVTEMESCLGRSSQSADAFVECIGRAYEAKQPGSETEARSWLSEPPSWTIWSGVREKEYVIDSDLSFLRSPTGSGPGDRLWPFDFLVQVAFTSEPQFLPAGAEPGAYVDEDPYELPGLDSVIERAILSALDRDPALREQLEELKSFTILQRLFRAALSSRLGESFPLEKLILLAEECVKAVGTSPTARWNYRPGMIEAVLAQELTELSAELHGPDDLVDRARSAFRTCISTIGAASRPDAIPDQAWVARCDLASLGGEAREACDEDGAGDSVRRRDGCLIRIAVGLWEDATKARRIRAALGVAADEKRARDSGRCAHL